MTRRSRTVIAFACATLMAGCPGPAPQEPAAPPTPAQKLAEIEGLYHQGRNELGTAKLLELAKSGYPEAQYALGRVYLEGTRAAKDVDKAIEWIKAAAANGHAEAKEKLARMRAEGLIPEVGTSAETFKEQEDRYNDAYYLDNSKDKPEEAFQIYLALAKEGHLEAEYATGWAYRHGRGVKQDDEQAMFWLEKAAARRHERASKLLDEIRKEKRLPQ